MILIEKLTTEEIIEYLNSKGIKNFWHFTDASNLETIKKYGLQSLWNIKRLNIPVNRFGGNNLSHQLDYEKNLDLYVHLAFMKDHPMYHKAKKDGRIINPVWLEIDIRVLFNKECYFCPTVANKTNANPYNFDRIMELDFDKFYHYSFDIRKEARKAEILVKSKIEPFYIKGIYYGS